MNESAQSALCSVFITEEQKLTCIYAPSRIAVWNGKKIANVKIILRQFKLKLNFKLWWCYA